MTSFWIFFGVLHGISLIIFFLSLARVKNYIQPYHLSETKKTKLFGFLRLGHIYIIYLITIIAAIFLQGGIILTFLL